MAKIRDGLIYHTKTVEEDPVFHDNDACDRLEDIDADNVVVRRRCEVCASLD
jgi:hypothetical protein